MEHIMTADSIFYEDKTTKLERGEWKAGRYLAHAKEKLHPRRTIWMLKIFHGQDNKGETLINATVKQLIATGAIYILIRIEWTSAL